MSKQTSNSIKRILSMIMVVAMLMTMMPVTASAAEGTTLYLQPNSNWLIDNARFAVYYWNGSGSGWASMSSAGSGLYSATIPAGYSNVIFCRMNPANTTNDWSNKWNQTADLTIPTDGNNCYTVAAGTWDNGGGSWSYIPSYYSVSYALTNLTSSNTASSIQEKTEYTTTLTAEEGYALPETVSVTVGGAEVSGYTYADGVLTVPAELVTGNLAITAEAVKLPTDQLLYLKPNSNWEKDGARFAVYYWDDYGSNWASMSGPDADGYYSVIIPAGYSNVIFCRMNPASSTNDWSSKWNQTSDLTVPTNGSNCYTVAEGAWDKGSGSWSYYAPAVEESTEPTEEPAPAVDYYLVGYINGADYGCNDDWANLGEYKFESGKLTATFTQDSYVFIKTGDNAGWYMASAYCTDTTVTLANTSTGTSEKLFVPGNVELTFTLVENTDGSLTLSYTAVEEEPTEPEEPAVDYYLVGYINGADYGIAGDSANLGEYKFVSGKLTVTFTQDSYVLVKNGSNVMYQSESYCTANTVTLKVGAAEKLFVPGNVELTFTLVENADGTLTLSYEADAGEVPEDAEYYLVGYINGADHGIAGDSANLGNYKFESGKLTVTFTQDSYVVVKTNSNVMYMSETYCTADTVTLKVGAAEKLFVPGNVELTFTLTVNTDGTLTLSYTSAGSEEPASDYYLVGYINGADHGIAGDSANLGSYKFESGKLTVTFTQDSYVLVKNSNNVMYQSESYCTDTSVTLKIGAAEKLFVPGNVELTFTLVENADGTLTLSYAEAAQVPEGYTTVTIHFLKTEGWGSNINGYIWTTGGALAGYEDYNAWPGKAISASAGHPGWYDLIVSTENPTAFNFIFNDGGNQTADLTTGEITGDTELWVIGNSVMTTAPGEWTGDYDYTVHLHFQKPAAWGSNINLYTWEGLDNGGWPGAAVEADAVNAGWYNFSVTLEENTGFNFIFNDGNGNQTADLATGELQVTTHLWIVDGAVQTTAPDGWVDPDLKVYVPGTFPGPSWDAASNQMTYDAELGLYVYTFANVPAANYEFKIAINGSWNENYGVGGTRDGANIAVTVPQAMDVTVYYNPKTHIAVTNVNYVFADIYLSGTGIPEGTKMTDEGLTGIYSVKVPMEAGTYSDIKITCGDKTYVFALIELGIAKDVTFYLDPVTGIYYCDASNTPIDTAKIYFNSQDTTYKSEFGAIATGESCTFSIDTGADILSAVLVIKGVESVPMTATETESGKRWSCEASVDNIGEYDYYFALSNGATIAIYGDDDGYYGEGKVTDLVNVLPYDLVVYKAGYETPDWMKKAVIYQIFPDRFFDGDMTNNQAQTTARGDVQYEYVNNWYLWPENPEQESANPGQYPDNAYKGDGEWSNEIYGGDLKGIIEKVDYLKALGVNVIYLNPVFSSISNHRYDACDYTEIDPILGTMGDFEELVAVAEANDMQIILDGVFNHVSDDSVYFDRYYKFLGTSPKIGAYPYWAYVYDYMAEQGASQADAEVAAKAYFSENYGITDYSYTEWFEVYNTAMSGAVDSIGLRAGKSVYSYDGWWGYDSMPIIYATNGSEYQTGNWAEEIIYNEDGTSVTQYWITKGNDGWRLDVANEVSDETWQKFRDSVKAMNDGDVVIIGEIWDDATKYLLGDMYDSVMNYMFRNAVTAFAMGTSSEQTMKELEKLRERYPEEAFYAMMNLVGSHDTSRILSFLDGIGDDRADKTPGAAYPTYETTSDLAKNRQFLVAFLQFTYPGAPTIYYGDELGMVGSDDPDDRRAMEWGKGNQELVEWYANLAAIRAQYPALSTGAIRPIDLGDSNLLAYTRSEGDVELIVIGNNNSSDKTVKIAIPKSESYVDLVTGKEYTDEVTVEGLRGVILVRKSQYVDVSVDTEKLAPAYDSDYTVPVEEREETAPEKDYTTQDGQQVALGEELTFTVEDALVNTFVKVLVDGEEVEVQVASGIAGTDTTGTTITLSPELIEKLGLGEHSIEIVFEGGSASASFTVVEEIEETTAPTEKPSEETTEATETTEESKNPTTETKPGSGDNVQTGDGSHVILWTAMMLLSAAAALAIIFQRKKIIE